MALLDKVGRLARLAGILGVAAGAVVVSMCSRSPSGPAPDATTSDAAAPLDAGVDATAAEDGSTGDDGSTEQPDARLWDVLCE